MSKVAKLSEKALRALEMLKDGDMTAQDMKAKGFEDLNSAHLTALVSRELATATKVKLVCGNCGSKRVVNRYALTQKGKDYSPE